MVGNQWVETPPTDENEGILELIIAFNALAEQTNSVDLFALNEQKLILIRRFETIINRHVPLRFRAKPTHEQNSPPDLQGTCQKLFYQFLLVFGLFQDALGGYLFWNALFLLIPHISNPVLVALSLVCTALGSILYYAFQVAFLKDVFNLAQDNTDLGLLLASYSSQLETIIAMNQVLSSMWMLPIDNAIYDEYAQLLTRLNQDLRHQHETLEAYTETPLQQILKASTLAFGALASIASSYFTSNLLMSTLAASLVGTPLGWTMILLTIVADLGYYYAMGATSMVQFINPDIDNYQTFRKRLCEFNTTYQDDLQEIRAIKQCCFFKGTQTSDNPLPQSKTNCFPIDLT